MSSRTSDLVRDSRLPTRFIAGAIQHVYYSSTAKRRRIRTEETWRRQQELGNGTFGRVWLEGCVSGEKQGQLRAVKEISKDGASTAIDYGRELEAIAKFSHGNYVHCFVRSFGWYETNDAVFIAMEYLEHGDLQKHLTGPLPEEEVKEISSQLVEGLVFMHDNGFAHRDLKPGNILVLQPGPEWWIKISDFGISKRAEEENTALRTLIGTEGYLAPELKGFVARDDDSETDSNSPSYTFAVDIWSLGEIIFRMVSHEAAFRNPRDLFNYVVNSRSFPVEPLRKNSASEDCVDFVTKCMSASPLRRPTARDAFKHVWIQVSRSGSRSSSRGSDMASEVATTVASTILTDDTPLQSPSYQSSYTASSTSLNATAQWSTASWQDMTSRSLQLTSMNTNTPTRSLSPVGSAAGLTSLPGSVDTSISHPPAAPDIPSAQPVPNPATAQWSTAALTQQSQWGIPTGPPAASLGNGSSVRPPTDPSIWSGPPTVPSVAPPIEAPIAPLTSQTSLSPDIKDPRQIMAQRREREEARQRVMSVQEMERKRAERETRLREEQRQETRQPLFGEVVPDETVRRKQKSLSAGQLATEATPNRLELGPLEAAVTSRPPPVRQAPPPPTITFTPDGSVPRKLHIPLGSRTPLHLSNVVTLIVLIQRVAHIKAMWRDQIKRRNVPATPGLYIRDNKERELVTNGLKDPQAWRDLGDSDVRKDRPDEWRLNSETARLMRMTGFRSGTALDSVMECSQKSYYLEYGQREMAGCITQLATKRGTGRNREVVAVKMAEYPQAFVLRQEAKCLLSLDHPCIIKILDIAKWEKGFGLILPSEPSADLDQLCRFQYGISETDALHVFEQLLSAVKYLQHEGMVHTKLTPHSILARRGSNDEISIVVTDLQDWLPIGAASSPRGDEVGEEEVVKLSSWERQNYVFLPPERWLFHGYTASVYTDLWSCGLILANMLEPLPSDGLSAARPKQFVLCTLKYHVTEVLVKRILKFPKVTNPRIKQALLGTLQYIPERRMLVRDLFQYMFQDDRFSYNTAITGMAGTAVPHELHTLRQSSSRSFHEKRLNEYYSTVAHDDVNRSPSRRQIGLTGEEYDAEFHNDVKPRITLVDRPASSMAQSAALRQGSPLEALLRPSRSSLNLSAHSGVYVQSPGSQSIPWN